MWAGPRLPGQVSRHTQAPKGSPSHQAGVTRFLYGSFCTLVGTAWSRAQGGEIKVRLLTVHAHRWAGLEKEERWELKERAGPRGCLGDLPAFPSSSDHLLWSSVTAMSPRGVGSLFPVWAPFHAVEGFSYQEGWARMGKAGLGGQCPRLRVAVPTTACGGTAPRYQTDVAAPLPSCGGYGPLELHPVLVMSVSRAASGDRQWGPLPPRPGTSGCYFTLCPPTFFPTRCRRERTAGTAESSRAQALTQSWAPLRGWAQSAGGRLCLTQGLGGQRGLGQPGLPGGVGTKSLSSPGGARARYCSGPGRGSSARAWVRALWCQVRETQWKASEIPEHSEAEPLTTWVGTAWVPLQGDFFQ